MLDRKITFSESYIKIRSRPSQITNKIYHNVKIKNHEVVILDLNSLTIIFMFLSCEF